MRYKAYGAVLAVLLCSCGPAVDYIALEGGGGEEAAFLVSALENNPALADLGLGLAGDGGGRAGIIISFHTSWEFENAWGDAALSKTWFVPRSDPLEGRKEASLASCLAGEEDLVPLEELAPPYTALRVDGLAADAGGYPLVRVAGLRVRPVKESARLAGKVKALRALIEGLPAPLIQAQPEIAWIVSGGDLMLDRGATHTLLEEGPAGVFGGTAELLASSDLALVNLEGPVSGRGRKVKKSFNFRFEPAAAPALKAAGIDAVLQANNHAFDYGMDAFLDSLSSVAGAGIGVLGAARTDGDAARPWVAEAAGLVCRVYGIASFPRERNGWDGLTAAAAPDKAGMLHAGRGGAELLKASFAEAAALPAGGKAKPSGGQALPAGGKALPALDIVLFHGGAEWSRRPDAATRELYTDLVRAGADLVIGSHPHVVQGFEWVQGKPIFWSLGNYVFAGMENTEGGEEGLFIRLGYWGSSLVYLEPYALALSHTCTEIAPDEKLRTFYERSRSLREAEE
jgi:poly-gamma-glutamate synthesis protein (capsule biosynthesis protein)